MRLQSSIEVSQELEHDYKTHNKHGAFEEVVSYELAEMFFRSMFDKFKDEIRKTVNHNIYNKLEPGQNRYNTRTIVLDVLTIDETTDILYLLRDIVDETDIIKREELSNQIRAKFKI